MTEKKGIAVLGSTGTMGTCAMEVIECNPDFFDLQVISAYSNSDLLIEQALKFQPNNVVIGAEDEYRKVKESLWNEDIHVYCGEEALSQVIESTHIHTVFNALKGYAGLKSSITAICAKKVMLVANRETLLVAGELISALAQKNGVNIYPLVPIQSAIFQSLLGEFHNPVEKISLMTDNSLRTFTFEQLKDMKVAQLPVSLSGLKDSKQVIDSMTQMHIGFELIQAKWLFNLKSEQLEIIDHPQSVVQSIVQFEDAVMKAHMGQSSICASIQYAMNYPYRIKSESSRFNFLEYPELTFDIINTDMFSGIDICFDVIDDGGTSACVLNASNEIAVQAFLKNQISFTEIYQLNKQVLKAIETKNKPVYDDYLSTDHESRQTALKLLS
tara:strand:+ start:1496 stop:2650 length:1155 start_codon:yes stop_codon:yes gene_type:complete